MVNLHELTEPIYYGTLKHLQENPQKPLESLQGNILRGHGRDRAIYIFFQFKNGQEADVKCWIKELATTERITSAQRQLDAAKQYRRYNIRGHLFMNFFLSAKGYEYLYPKHKGKLSFDDEAFLCGMKAAQHRLNDPPKNTWEPGYQHEIHAMALLAHDDEHSLRQAAAQLCGTVKAYTENCWSECGKVMWNQQDYAIEHFGYIDSRSQPLFFQSDIERESVRMGEKRVWDPGSGPDLVLVQDPYGRNGSDSGSYLVFRKLEQDVRAFKEYEQQFATTLGLTGDDVKRAGALVVGRFEDGTPVALKGTPGQSDLVPNNFTYDTDPNGQKCPLQAHIRKVNPRQAGVPRIVRRGITYGKRDKEPHETPRLEELPSEGVGLLFMCYQSNIAQQFEVLQYLANDPRAPGQQDPGIDPIIGQPGGNGVGQLKWPAQWDAPPDQHRSFDFHGFVTLKGGEYFFAPSIYFLKNIDTEIS